MRLKLKLIILILPLLLNFNVWPGVGLDGTQDHLTVDDSATLSFTGNGTISSWVKTDGSVTTQRIFHKEPDGNGRFTWGMTFSLNANEQPEISIVHTETPPHAHFLTSTTALTTGVKYQVGGVWDTPNLRIYINGDETDTLDVGAGTLRTGVNNNLVGASRNSSNVFSAFFPGTINELAVWNTAVSATEMKLLGKSNVKRMPLQIQPANLVMYLPLDDVPEGQTGYGEALWRDMSGNGNHATAGGTSAMGKREEILSYP